MGEYFGEQNNLIPSSHPGTAFIRGGRQGKLQFSFSKRVVGAKTTGRKNEKVSKLLETRVLHGEKEHFFILSE